jgi:NADH-quinone oxidoreductase subunit N
MGAFGVIIALAHDGERAETVDDFAGLWTVRPWMAIAMSVFMLALLGFPIFGGIGFFAKWLLVRATLESPFPGGRGLAIVLVITSVISAGYYLYVVMVMFMRSRSDAAGSGAPAGARGAWPTRFVVAAMAIAILVFGILPGRVAEWSERGALVTPVTRGQAGAARQ